MMHCILHHFISYNPHHTSTFGIRHEIDFFDIEVTIMACPCHAASINTVNEELHELFSFLFTSNQSWTDHPMTYHLQLFYLLDNVSHHTYRVDAFHLNIVTQRVLRE